MKLEKLLDVACPALVRLPIGDGGKRGRAASNLLYFIRDKFAKTNVPGVVHDPKSTVMVADLVLQLERVLTPGPREEFGHEKERDAALLEQVKDKAGMLTIKGLKTANDNAEKPCSECGKLAQAVCTHCGKPRKPSNH